MKYKQKVDLWIRLLIYASVFMFLPLSFTVPQNEQWIMLVTFVITATIMLPFLYGYVELQEEQLVVRAGLIKQTIPYNNIKSIRMCTNWLSSMAMTSKRIEIKEHKKGFLRGTTYIGPENREDCFQQLHYLCKNLDK